MGDVDQISSLLGEMRADMQENIRQREAVFRNIDEIKTLIQQQSGQIMLMGAQLTQAQADHSALKKQIGETIMPQIEDYKAKKNRILGWALGAGIGSGGAGAYLANLFKVGSGH